MAQPEDAVSQIHLISAAKMDTQPGYQTSEAITIADLKAASIDVDGRFMTQPDLRPPGFQSDSQDDDKPITQAEHSPPAPPTTSVILPPSQSQNVDTNPPTNQISGLPKMKDNTVTLTDPDTLPTGEEYDDDFFQNLYHDDEMPVPVEEGMAEEAGAMDIVVEQERMEGREIPGEIQEGKNETSSAGVERMEGVEQVQDVIEEGKVETTSALVVRDVSEHGGIKVGESECSETIDETTIKSAEEEGLPVAKETYLLAAKDGDESFPKKEVLQPLKEETWEFSEEKALESPGQDFSPALKEEAIPPSMETSLALLKEEVLQNLKEETVALSGKIALESPGQGVSLAFKENPIPPLMEASLTLSKEEVLQISKEKTVEFSEERPLQPPEEDIPSAFEDVLPAYLEASLALPMEEARQLLKEATPAVIEEKLLQAPEEGFPPALNEEVLPPVTEASLIPPKEEVLHLQKEETPAALKEEATEPLGEDVPPAPREDVLQTASEEPPAPPDGEAPASLIEKIEDQLRAAGEVKEERLAENDMDIDSLFIKPEEETAYSSFSEGVDGMKAAGHCIQMTPAEDDSKKAFPLSEVMAPRENCNELSKEVDAANIRGRMRTEYDEKCLINVEENEELKATPTVPSGSLSSEVKDRGQQSPAKGEKRENSKAAVGFQRASKEETNDVDDELFIPMKEEEKVPLPKEVLLTSKREENTPETDSSKSRVNMEAAREPQRQYIMGDDEDVIMLDKPALSKENPTTHKARSKSELKIEAAREFQRQMSKGDDEDVIMVDKTALPKNKSTTQNKSTKADAFKHAKTTPIQGQTHQIAGRRKDSGSSVEITAFHKVKKPIQDKPIQDKPISQPYKSHQKFDPRVKVEIGPKTDHTAKKPRSNIQTSIQSKTSQQTSDPRFKNDHRSKGEQTIEKFIQTKLPQKQYDPPAKSNIKPASTTTTSSPSKIKQSTPSTPAPKPKTLHWKDVKEKSPSTKYGHDVNRPLGPDDGSMDAFIITESKPDPKPASKYKTVRFRDPVDDVFVQDRKVPNKQSGEVQQRRQVDERLEAKILREEKERQRRLQEGRPRKEAQQQRPLGQRAAPVAHMYNTATTTCNGGGGSGGAVSNVPNQCQDTHKQHESVSNSSRHQRSMTPAPETVRECHIEALESNQQRTDPTPISGRSDTEQNKHGVSTRQISSSQSRPGDRVHAGRIGSAGEDVASSSGLPKRGDIVKGYHPPTVESASSSSSSSPNFPSRPGIPPTTKAAVTSPLYPSSSSTEARSHHRASDSTREGRNGKTPPSPVTAPISSQKRTISSFGVGELFDPCQIVSKEEDERRKRQKLETEDGVQKGEPATPVDVSSDRKRGRSGEEDERAGKRRKSGVEMADGQVVWSDQRGNDGWNVEEGVLHIKIPAGQVEETQELLEEVLEVADSQEQARAPESIKGHVLQDHSDQIQQSDRRNHESEAIEEPAIASSKPFTAENIISEMENAPCAPPSRAASPTLTPPPTVHPRTSRKTLSDAQLAWFQSATSSDTSTIPVSSSDAEDDAPSSEMCTQNAMFSGKERSSRHRELDFTAVDGECLYRYTVTRRDFGPDIAAKGEETVREIGSYYSLKEANLQAVHETGRERTVSAERKRNRKGWMEDELSFEDREPGSDIHITTDEFGCRSWRIVDTFGEGVAVDVVRDIAPRRERVPFVLRDAFFHPRKVYVVLQLLKFRPVTPDDGDGEDGSDSVAMEAEQEVEFATLGVHTAFDLANKRAGKAVVEFQKRGLDKTCEGILAKNELERKMRDHQKELDRDGGLFDETVELEDGGMMRVWVEMNKVEGPRN